MAARQRSLSDSNINTEAEVCTQYTPKLAKYSDARNVMLSLSVCVLGSGV